MSIKKDVDSLLQQYAAETGVYSTQKVESDFMEMSDQVATEQVLTGLSEAIRSEQTPPFDQMVCQAFEQGNSDQRAGVLNQLLDGAGPAIVASLTEIGVLRAPEGEQAPVFTPELAEQLPSELVRKIAQEAAHHNPGIIEAMSSLYAGDPALATTLGGETLSLAMSKIAESR